MLGPMSINVRLTAVRKFAVEAADNGLLAAVLAAGIARIKCVRAQGVRTGNWLTLRQAQALLGARDIETTKGLRDRAIIAVLLGCGLRRSEVAALTFGHIQQQDGRWCIINLVGIHHRVRTVPTPIWVKVAIARGHQGRNHQRSHLPAGESLRPGCRRGCQRKDYLAVAVTIRLSRGCCRNHAP
jgi:integrase